MTDCNSAKLLLRLALPCLFRMSHWRRIAGLLLLALCAPMFSNSPSWAEIVRQQSSRPGPNEVDTADRGGQIGGFKLGRDYQLIDLRCGLGEAIVGLQTRRGSVLDYVQIRCAKPICDGRGCQWKTSYAGPSAGNSSGGNPQPLMQCRRNETLSGIRGSSVTFTVFDYAADIEIECAPMTSPPTGQGIFATGQGNSATVANEGFSSDGSRGLRRGSAFVSCAGDYGYSATAVSVGESDFVNRGQRVVQAVSLYCPNNAPVASVSNASRMIDAMDRCLRDESLIVYYIAPNRQTYSGSAGYGNRAILYDPNFLDRQPPYLRAYTLADAFAAYVLDLQRQRYPVRNESLGYRTQATDIIVGFLARCLRSKENLLQRDSKDPRDWFVEYRRVSLRSQRESDFSLGWGLFGAGLPRAITMER